MSAIFFFFMTGAKPPIFRLWFREKRWTYRTNSRLQSRNSMYFYRSLLVCFLLSSLGLTSSIHHSKPTTVEKLIPLEYDLNLLAAFDTNPLDASRLKYEPITSLFSQHYQLPYGYLFFVIPCPQIRPRRLSQRTHSRRYPAPPQSDLLATHQL